MRIKIYAALMLLLILTLLSVPFRANAAEKGRGSADGESYLRTSASIVMLQGFHWESHMSKSWWKVMQGKTNEIFKAGIDMVWFPPSSRAASDEGYLPNRLMCQDSMYGTADELRKTISTFHSKGIKAIADVVINHRVGSSDWADFTEPTWGPKAVCSDDEWAWAKGNPDTGCRFNAGRDIDHTQDFVRKSIIQWLKWLKSDIGYDGWRFDYAKGFSGEYVGKYNSATSPIFSVGEFWDDLDINNPDAHRQQLCDWIDITKGKSAVFDFTTKGLLQRAVATGEYWRMRDREGKPAGLIGWWPGRAATFIDNHDTGPSTGGQGGQNHWPFPSGKVMQGYAYTLTHPGTPNIYWVHLFDWGLYDNIRMLVALRKKCGINSESKVDIVDARQGLYAAIIDKKVAMKMGPESWSPGDGWKIGASGNDYAVWYRTSSKEE